MKRKLKKYRVEIIIITIAVFVTITSLIIYFQTFQNAEAFTETSLINSENNIKLTKIYVDVSGSVNKPDLYEASNNTRLKELIEKAGGLSDNADKDFFYRNFNLSRIVTDQEKIYVPSIQEVSTGYFIEETRVLNYLNPIINNNSPNTESYLININSATIEELDTLPGVGKVTAQKIIDNRPFEALENLIDKKIVNKTVYENIKNLISINN